jgi:diguanylate cyclase (GGDEF)-like protein
LANLTVRGIGAMPMFAEIGDHSVIKFFRGSTWSSTPLSWSPTSAIRLRPILRNIAVVVLVLGSLTAGNWMIVTSAVDFVLTRLAAQAARDWAQYVTDNVADLEQVAAGAQPSAASTGFFRLKGISGVVFRYDIYSPEGHLIFAADRGMLTRAGVSEFSADAARALKTQQPIAVTRDGRSAGLPPVFVLAYVPVVLNRRPVAVVAPYIDQSEQRAIGYFGGAIASVVISSITGLAFMIPAIGWYRRTKEKQQADRRIRFLAHHDALTGLANRAQLIEKLEAALSVLPLRGGSLAVHFIDLDRFKEVNDSLGHDGGDFLLKTVADRLRGIIRIDDLVARLGGDEFVVVQIGISGKHEAEDFARRLTAAVTTPMTLNEHEIVASASVGIALAPVNGTDPDRLLKSADLALYKSKADGRNCIRFFLPEMDTALQARLALEKTMRNAVLHDRFVIHYQPVFEVSGKNLIGFEALIRMTAEDGTLISPQTFIPVAEDMRLIDRIGAWVLREACRTAATWPEPLTIAVNLSPLQFEAGNVGSVVLDALTESGLAPRRLELEITETLLLGDNEAIRKQLRTLKAMGVKIVMDDFGTGYSSLSYLWRFPFDKIKIDRSFMQGFDTAGRDSETVVKTIVGLGRALNMRVTVEGVETAQQAVFLDELDADLVQGFYFGRPMPNSETGAEILKNFQKSLPAQSTGSVRGARPRIVTTAADH